jgi:hypothetical protein
MQRSKNYDQDGGEKNWDQETDHHLVKQGSDDDDGRQQDD